MTEQDFDPETAAAMADRIARTPSLPIVPRPLGERQRVPAPEGDDCATWHGPDTVPYGVENVQTFPYTPESYTILTGQSRSVAEQVAGEPELAAGGTAPHQRTERHRQALIDSGHASVLEEPMKPDPPKWRVIVTDSETESGVAPVCPRQTEAGWSHDRGVDYQFRLLRYDQTGVYDCCPHPHLECWGAQKARAVRDVLNSLSVEACS